MMRHVHPTREVLHSGINDTGEPLHVGYRILPHHLFGVPDRGDAMCEA